MKNVKYQTSFAKYGHLCALAPPCGELWKRKLHADKQIKNALKTFTFTNISSPNCLKRKAFLLFTHLLKQDEIVKSQTLREEHSVVVNL